MSAAPRTDETASSASLMREDNMWKHLPSCLEDDVVGRGLRAPGATADERCADDRRDGQEHEPDA
jgi:hypothetical protein